MYLENCAGAFFNPNVRTLDLNVPIVEVGTFRPVRGKINIERPVKSLNSKRESG